MTDPLTMGLGYISWKLFRGLLNWLKQRHKAIPTLEPKTEVDPSIIKREKVENAIQADLKSLREQIRELGCAGIDSDNGLLRDRMLLIFVARKPQIREEWFRIPLEFREQTGSDQVKRYLSAVLFAISRHRDGMNHS
jgi:hypothetical protein